MNFSLNLSTGKSTKLKHTVLEVTTLIHNKYHILHTLFLVFLFLSFKEAHHQNILLEFLKSVGTCYLEQGRTKDFVLDLLALDVPDLFMMEYQEGSTSTIHSDILSSNVPDEFTHFLTEYIQRNHLQEELLAETERIWVSAWSLLWVVLFLN